MRTIGTATVFACIWMALLGQLTTADETVPLRQEIAQLIERAGVDTPLIRQATRPFLPTKLDPVLVDSEWRLVKEDIERVLKNRGYDAYPLNLYLTWENAPRNPAILKARILVGLFPPDVTQSDRVDPRTETVRSNGSTSTAKSQLAALQDEVAAGLGVTRESLVSIANELGPATPLDPRKLKAQYWSSGGPNLNQLRSDILAMIQRNSPTLRRFNLGTIEQDLAHGFEVAGGWVPWKTTMKHAWSWRVFVRVERTGVESWTLTTRIDVGVDSGTQVIKQYDTDHYLPTGLIAATKQSYILEPTHDYQVIVDGRSAYYPQYTSSLSTLSSRVFSEVVAMVSK